MGEQLTDATALHDSTREWNYVRRVLRYTGRPAKRCTGDHLPIRRDGQGKVIETPQELAEKRLRHFGAIEDAIVLDSMTDLIRIYGRRANDNMAHTHTQAT